MQAGASNNEASRHIHIDTAQKKGRVKAHFETHERNQLAFGSNRLHKAEYHKLD
jgi:hypothetical protein